MKLKAFLCAFLLIISLPSWGALRGQSGAADAGTTVSSFSITYSGSAIQVGDLELLATCVNTGGGEGTITNPSGFTAGASLSPTLADVNIDSSAAFLHLAVKIAAAGDTGTPTYTTTSDTPSYWSQQLYVFSGRKNSSVSTSFNNQVATASSAETATPYTYNMTGLTALSGDDIAAIICEAPPSGRSTYTFTTAITGYSNNLNTIGGNNFSPGLSVLSKTGVTSGATGTLAATISATGSVSPATGGFVLSLPAGGAPVKQPGQFFFSARNWTGVQGAPFAVERSPDPGHSRSVE